MLHCCRQSRGRDVIDIELQVLKRAIKENHVSEIRDIVQVKTERYKGRGLLHYACCEGTVEIVQMLLDFGFDVNEKDEVGNTPLHMACHHTNFNLANFLFEKGSAIQEMNNESDCAMRGLALKCHAIWRNWQYDEAGQDILCGQELHHLHHEDHVEILKILNLFRNRGRKIDATNSRDQDTVRKFLSSGTKEYVDLFIKWGYDYRQVDSESYTLLHYAASDGNWETAEELLKYIDINSISLHGTPLHLAALFGKAKCAEVLLKHGCIEDVWISGMSTPIMVCAMSRFPRTAQVLETLVNCRRKVNGILESNTDFEIIKFQNFFTTNKKKISVLVSHFIQMKMAGYDVKETMLQRLLSEKDIREINFNDYEEDCADEIERMKNTKITDKLSYYQFMTKSADNTCWYLNPHVVKIFENYSHVRMFPLYSDCLYIAFKNVRRRRRLLDASEPILTDLLSYFQIPGPAMRMILNYFSDDDLTIVSNSNDLQHDNKI